MKRKPPALRSIGIDLNARSIGTFCCDYEVELVTGAVIAFWPTTHSRAANWSTAIRPI